jgi:hypothetical protein
VCALSNGEKDVEGEGRGWLEVIREKFSIIQY